jgi:hypothetical protein
VTTADYTAGGLIRDVQRPTEAVDTPPAPVVASPKPKKAINVPPAWRRCDSRELGCMQRAVSGLPGMVYRE